MELHSSDPREYVYTKKQLENAQTHDDLWNAAQLQLVEEGKMHGFLRMYWAKKVRFCVQDVKSSRSRLIRYESI